MNQIIAHASKEPFDIWYQLLKTQCLNQQVCVMYHILHIIYIYNMLNWMSWMVYHNPNLGLQHVGAWKRIQVEKVL
jgi:hypothetical protein